MTPSRVLSGSEPDHGTGPRVIHLLFVHAEAISSATVNSLNINEFQACSCSLIRHHSKQHAEVFSEGSAVRKVMDMTTPEVVDNTVLSNVWVNQGMLLCLPV